MLRLNGIGVLGVLCSAAAVAQSGSVTGHVTYGDTAGPARLATVMLMTVPSKLTMPKTVDTSADLKQQMSAGLANLSKAFSDQSTTLQATAGPDGSFAISEAPPGDYYAFAGSSGYISPLAQVEAIVAGGADLSKPLPGIPVVRVTANHSANVELTLQRGGAISGTIKWDDGSPVKGAIFTVTQKDGDPRPPSQFNMLGVVNALGSLSMSDDLGQYRIAGLAPGDYILKATVRTESVGAIGKGASLTRMMMSPMPVVLFSPAAFRKADAKAVTVRAGDDIRNVDLTLNLGSLHTVSGRVTSLQTHTGVNQANVKLIDSSDKTLVRNASVDANGNYTVTFVPSGTYQMIVQDAEDTEPVPPDPKSKPRIFADEKTLRSYKDGKATVVVAGADVTGQNVELVAKTKAESDAEDAADEKSAKDLSDVLK